MNTNIHEAVLTRPKHLSNTGYYGADPVVMKSLKEVISPGYDPVDLGEIVVRAVQENQLYIIPYAEFSGPMQERLDMALKVIPDPKDDPGMAAREAAMTRGARSGLRRHRRAESGIECGAKPIAHPRVIAYKKGLAMSAAFAKRSSRYSLLVVVCSAALTIAACSKKEEELRSTRGRHGVAGARRPAQYRGVARLHRAR